MNTTRYSVFIGEAHCVTESAPYPSLVRSIVEFTARAAVARSNDESDWADEELRRKGLGALHIFRNGRAVWFDPKTFESELAEARREHIESRFKRGNELDPQFLAKLDRDLRARWRKAGYKTPSLRADMKRLFVELERDLSDRARGARAELVSEIFGNLA